MDVTRSTFAPGQHRRNHRLGGVGVQVLDRYPQSFIVVNVTDNGDTGTRTLALVDAQSPDPTYLFPAHLLTESHRALIAVTLDVSTNRERPVRVAFQQRSQVTEIDTEPASQFSLWLTSNVNSNPRAASGARVPSTA